MSKTTELDEFADNVTLHGFRYLVQERGVTRLIWYVICASAFIGCVLLSYNTLSDYIQHKHYAVIGLDFHAEEAQFPTITACVINTESFPKIMHSFEKHSRQHNSSLSLEFEDFIAFYDQYIKGKKFLNNTDNKIKQPPGEKAGDATKVVEYLKEQGVNSTQGVYEFFQVTMDIMLGEEKLQKFAMNTTCAFKGEKCAAQDFETTLLWPHNLCYSFNSATLMEMPTTEHGKKKEYGMRGPMNVASYGTANGLRVFLDLKASDTSSMERPYQGVDLYVHPYGTTHFVEAHTTHFYLAPGIMHMVSLSEKQRMLLPAPYETDCKDTSMQMLTQLNYTRTTCIVDCLVKTAYETCGCVGFEMHAYVDEAVEICDITTGPSAQVCYNNVIAAGENKGAHMRMCEMKCPLQCEDVVYDVQISSARLGSDYSYKAMVGTGWHKCDRTCKMMNKNLVMENYIGISISFTSLVKVKETMTQSVSLSTMLGTVGGSVGLCLGFSIVTGFEFLLFLWKQVTRLFYNRPVTPTTVNDAYF